MYEKYKGIYILNLILSIFGVFMAIPELSLLIATGHWVLFSFSLLVTGLLAFSVYAHVWILNQPPIKE